MTFRKRWCSRTVTSSDGYSVTFVGRSLIVYQEKKLRVYISADMLVGKPPGWAFSLNDMSIGSEEGEELNDMKLCSLIGDRIKAVGAYLRLKIVIN